MDNLQKLGCLRLLGGGICDRGGVSAAEVPMAVYGGTSCRLWVEAAFVLHVFRPTGPRSPFTLFFWLALACRLHGRPSFVRHDSID
jgi:hypothetical protein